MIVRWISSRDSSARTTSRESASTSILLPEDCPERFYERFGPPIAETRLPAEGRVRFMRARSTNAAEPTTTQR